MWLFGVYWLEDVKVEPSTANPSNELLCGQSFPQSHNSENQINNIEKEEQSAAPQFNWSLEASTFSTQPTQQWQQQSQPSASAQPVIKPLDGTQQAAMQELKSCRKELEFLRNENKVLKEDLKTTKCEVEDLQICLNLLDDKLQKVTRQRDEKIEIESRLKKVIDMEVLRLTRKHKKDLQRIQADFQVKLKEQQKLNDNLKQEKDNLQQHYNQQCLNLSIFKKKLERFEEEAKKKNGETVRLPQNENASPQSSTTNSIAIFKKYPPSSASSNIQEQNQNKLKKLFKREQNKNEEKMLARRQLSNLHLQKPIKFDNVWIIADALTSVKSHLKSNHNDTYLANAKQSLPINTSSKSISKPLVNTSNMLMLTSLVHENVDDINRISENTKRATKIIAASSIREVAGPSSPVKAVEPSPNLIISDQPLKVQLKRKILSKFQDPTPLTNQAIKSSTNSEEDNENANEQVIFRDLTPADFGAGSLYPKPKHTKLNDFVWTTNLGQKIHPPRVNSYVEIDSKPWLVGPGKKGRAKYLENDVLKCPYCEDSRENKYLHFRKLKEHLAKHLGAKMFRCKHCKIRYIHLRARNRHEENCQSEKITSKTAPYQCFRSRHRRSKFGPYLTSRADSFRTHMLTEHGLIWSASNPNHSNIQIDGDPLEKHNGYVKRERKTLLKSKRQTK